MSPVKYELGFYIPEDGILHSHCHENLKSYIAFTGWTLLRTRNVSPVKYELGLYIPEDDFLHSRLVMTLYEKFTIFVPFTCSKTVQSRKPHNEEGAYEYSGRIGRSWERRSTPQPFGPFPCSLL
jgi:hypothetical protein